MLIPIFFASITVTKFVTFPLKGIFKNLNHQGEKTYDFLGRTGKLKATIQEDKLGTMELYIQGDPIKILVKSNHLDVNFFY